MKKQSYNIGIEDILSQTRQKILSRPSDWAHKPNCINQLTALYKLVENIEDRNTKAALINIISSILQTDVTQLGDDLIQILSNRIMSIYSESPSPFDQFILVLKNDVLYSALDEETKEAILTNINKEFNSIPRPDLNVLRRAKASNNSNRSLPPPAPSKRVLNDGGTCKRTKLKHVSLDANNKAKELPDEIWHPERLSITQINKLAADIQAGSISLDNKLTYSTMLASLVHASKDLARVTIEKGFFDRVECDEIVADYRAHRLWDIGALAIFLSQNIKDHRDNLENYIKQSCSKCIIAARYNTFADVTDKIASTIKYDIDLKAQLETLANSFRSKIIPSPFEARLMQQ